MQSEIDVVFSLLSYSIVYKHWVVDDRNDRGYNVGVILVNPQNEVVDWNINAVNIRENCTQHGEVRLITSYLDKEGIYALNDYTVYPTLEPCAMCAGMMTMASIRRTVNGQKDYDFSKAIERLAFDSRSINGYPPYPRTVISEPSPCIIAKELDTAYAEYLKLGNKSIITKFLSTETARSIFERALDMYLNYECMYEENQSIYLQSLSFFNNLSPKF